MSELVEKVARGKPVPTSTVRMTTSFHGTREEIADLLREDAHERQRLEKEYPWKE